MKKWMGLLILACALVFIAPIDAFAKVHGVFRVVKGKVQVKNGKTGKTKRAKIGQKVFPKDTIITGNDSRAKIVMVDKNVINISPDSNLEIENYEFEPTKGKKNVLLNVIYGKVRSKVNQKYDGKEAKFQVKTKSAVAGVRGTDFLASFDRQSNQSQIVTFEGEVSFGQPGPGGSIKNPVAVKVGQMAEAAAGAPPAPPTSVPKQMLAKMDSESNAETASGSDSDKREPANKDKDKKEKKDDADDKKGGDKKKDDKEAKGDKNSKGGDKAKSESDKKSGDDGKKADKGDKGSKGDQAKGGDKASKGDQAKGGDKGSGGDQAKGGDKGTKGDQANGGDKGQANGKSGPGGDGPKAGSGGLPGSDGGNGDSATSEGGDSKAGGGDQAAGPGPASDDGGRAPASAAPGPDGPSGDQAGGGPSGNMIGPGGPGGPEPGGGGGMGDMFMDSDFAGSGGADVMIGDDATFDTDFNTDIEIADGVTDSIDTTTPVEDPCSSNTSCQDIIDTATSNIVINIINGSNN